MQYDVTTDVTFIIFNTLTINFVVGEKYLLYENHLLLKTVSILNIEFQWILRIYKNHFLYIISWVFLLENGRSDTINLGNPECLGSWT